MLSILICTVPEKYRSQTYSSSLINSLVNQAHGKSVQILYLGDNISMSVGAKRNKLLQIADGERIIFVDDDDRVADNYVDKVLEYSLLDFDCVTIGVEYRQENSNLKYYDYRYKKNINTRDKNGRNIAGRVPNHLCLWRKEIAMRVKFPDQNLAEDHEWANLQVLKGYSVHHEDEVIYYYDFQRENSLTRYKR